MNTPMARPRVTAVPASDHQHMAFSQPRGKNSSTSANRLGMNTSKLSQIRSVSAMSSHLLGARVALPSPPSPLSHTGEGEREGQECAFGLFLLPSLSPVFCLFFWLPLSPLWERGRGGEGSLP